MKKNISVLLFCCFFISPAVLAGSWSSPDYVRRVYPSSNGYVYVGATNPTGHINPGHCSSNYYYILDPNNARFKEIYQALLTAAASEKKAQIFIDGCIGSYPRILSVLFTSF